jgi:hypothetical protein
LPLGTLGLDGQALIASSLCHQPFGFLGVHSRSRELSEFCGHHPKRQWTIRHGGNSPGNSLLFRYTALKLPQ